MQEELFKVPEHVKARQANSNPMVRKAGLGPDGAKCKDCRFLIKTKPTNRVYYKCQLVGITHGAATDVRVGWDACRQYEVEDEPQLVRAVRKAALEKNHDN